MTNNTNHIAVFHSKDFRDSSMYGYGEFDKNFIKNMFDEGKYESVAFVDTQDLEEAYMKTNHMEQSWTENEGVKALVERTRSTSVGDIIMKADGMYIVASHGFDKL